ncbi:uncharacterized protein V6R79_010866 [Siganus canaliculatus]
MGVLEDRRFVLVLVLVLVSVERSVCVRCFARYHSSLSRCEDELGEVEEDDCCLNPRYGYEGEDGACHSCGPPAWSTWSSWSHCSVLCGGGVQQRTRSCYGLGQPQSCRKMAAKLETRPCSGTCCQVKGWSSWLSWSTCSVTCGGGGVRKRERLCSNPPECRSACAGPSQETAACPPQGSCPVHGGWSSWSQWSQCSGSCISGIAPTRQRRRTCSNPAPSSDTAPPGNRCPGDETEVQPCSGLPNCPEDGGWGEWSSPGPCSVSCGEGLQLSVRKCDQPSPRYGGRHCEGPSTRSNTCQSPCPVDGLWTSWSSWGECSSSCILRDRVPIRTRDRSCSNPAPSAKPPGRGCQGDSRETQKCQRLPHCPVDGAWSAWSPFSSCPVTCGVGLQVSTRACDRPAPQHGGQHCAGGKHRTQICQTKVHCPVDGVWSEWAPWKQCVFPFKGKVISCKQIGGMQSRERQCLHRAHNGSFCGADALTERRVCYDVDRCYMRGSWEGWEPWSLCMPPCGQTSQRVRRRICTPDYSGYNPTIGRMREPATFFGTPRADCGAAPDNGLKVEKQPCANITACS